MMDVHELNTKLHLLEIPLADLGCVTQLPGHVRAKWASQGSEGERSGSLQSIEAKLGRAERKREEFRNWVTDKARTRSKVKQTSEERRAKHLQRLQDRLVVAEANRLSTLEAVKLKAAAEQVKLEEVVSKLNERLERKAQKIDEGLKAAEKRRQALMEAEKERLNAMHELVLARLVSAREREGQDLSERLRTIESRLQQAGEMRHAHLAERAARASEKVARAKHVSMLTRRLAQQDAQQRITSWRAKLEGAAERRQSRQARHDLESQKHPRNTSRPSRPTLSEAEKERLSLIHHSMRARHVQNMWRSFVKRRKTTAALASSFVQTNVTGLKLPESPDRSILASGESDNGSSIRGSNADREIRQPPPVIIGSMSVGRSPAHAPFEEFAAKLQAPATLKLAQALLRRLEHRLQARGTANKSCAALLRRLFPRTPRNSYIERYPPRVFLCAYMIVRHPEIVFNATGERERSLSEAARDLLFAFELLLQRILEPPPTPLVVSPSKSPIGSVNGTPTRSPALSDHGSPNGSANGSPTNRTPDMTPDRTPNRTPYGSVAGSDSASPIGTPTSSTSPSRMNSPRSRSSPSPPGKINAPTVPPSPLKEGMQAYRAAMKLKLSTEASASVESGAAARVKAEGSPHKNGTHGGMNYITIGELLVQFDEVWLAYLDQFVAWKSHDAASLVAELVKMAVRLETSMRRKVGASGEEFDTRVARNKDLQAMVAQVKYDHQLLRERIAKLGGTQGLTRLKEAIEQACSQPVASHCAAIDSQPCSDADSTTSSRRTSYAGTESEWETDTATTPKSVYRPPGSAEGISVGKCDMSLDTLQQLAHAREAAMAASGAQRPPRPSLAAATNAASNAMAQRSPHREAAAANTGSGSATPLGTGIREWSAMHAAGLTNEQMVWELVYNPEFQLPMGDTEAAWRSAVAAATSAAPTPSSTPLSPSNPATPEEAMAALRVRARQAAERAFWESVQGSLRQGLVRGGGAAVASRLVSELAGTLVELVADPNRAASIQQQFAESELSQQLQATKGVSVLVAGGLDVACLLQVLDSLGRLLSVMGAPSQEGEVQMAHARMAEHLQEAVARGVDGQEGVEKLAKAVCQALRLMWSQLSLMKIQAANARLRSVAVALQGVGAVRYLRDKFRRSHHLPVVTPVRPDIAGEEPVEGQVTPPMLAAKLPRTCSWFDSTRGAVLSVMQRLQAASLQLPSEAVLASWLSSYLAAPVRMASGRGPAAHPATGVSLENLTPATNPVLPVQPMSWRGRLRCGLVSLLCASTPAACDTTPEILQWDGRRLHEAQNRFQQLLVCTASLLIAQQMRAANSLPPWNLTQQQEAKQKLLLTLEDPAMKLPDLITLLSQLAGSSTAMEEAQIRAAFTRIIDPAANAFQVMGASLSTCLSLLILCGPSLLELATSTNATSNSILTSSSAHASLSASGYSSHSPSAFVLSYAQREAAGGVKGDRDVASARSAVPVEVMEFAVGLRGLLGRGGSVILAPELVSLAKSILTMAAVSEAVHKDVFVTLSDEI